MANCAPLSFIDVTPSTYAGAMLGVNEKRNVALAVELFEWTYRRSIERYYVIAASMSAPDPIRTRYREQTGEAVRRVVQERHGLNIVLGDLPVPAADVDALAAAIATELQNLGIHNFARFRLPMTAVEQWLAGTAFAMPRRRASNHRSRKLSKNFGGR